MNIVERIQRLNDTAKILGSDGVERIWLTEQEYADMFARCWWVRQGPLWLPIYVDGVRILCKRGA